jgi:hypothetical protein
LWINTVHSALKMFNVQDKQGLSSIYTISENDTLLTSLELVKELTKWFTNFLAIADSGLQPRSLSLPKSLVHSILSLLPTLISVSDCVTKESNHILNVDRNQILSSEELLNCLLQVTCAPSLLCPLLVALENVTLSSHHVRLIQQQIIQYGARPSREDITKIARFILNCINNNRLALDWFHVLRSLMFVNCCRADSLLAIVTVIDNALDTRPQSSSVSELISNFYEHLLSSNVQIIKQTTNFEFNAFDSFVGPHDLYILLVLSTKSQDALFARTQIGILFTHPCLQIISNYNQNSNIILREWVKETPEILLWPLFDLALFLWEDKYNKLSTLRLGVYILNMLFDYHQTCRLKVLTKCFLWLKQLKSDKNSITRCQLCFELLENIVKNHFDDFRQYLDVLSLYLSEITEMSPPRAKRLLEIVMPLTTTYPSFNKYLANFLTNLTRGPFHSGLHILYVAIYGIALLLAYDVSSVRNESDATAQQSSNSNSENSKRVTSVNYKLIRVLYQNSMVPSRICRRFVFKALLECLQWLTSCPFSNPAKVCLLRHFQTMLEGRLRSYLSVRLFTNPRIPVIASRWGKFRWDLIQFLTACVIALAMQFPPELEVCKDVLVSLTNRLCSLSLILSRYSRHISISLKLLKNVDSYMTLSQPKPKDLPPRYSEILKDNQIQSEINENLWKLVPEPLNTRRFALDNEEILRSLLPCYLVLADSFCRVPSFWSSYFSPKFCPLDKAIQLLEIFVIFRRLAIFDQRRDGCEYKKKSMSQDMVEF